MKHLKKFESNTDIPEIGEYVFATTSEGDIETKLFIKTNIGQVKHILKSNTTKLGEFVNLKVYYQNVPNDLLNTDKDGDYWWIDPENILYHSKDKEELKTMKVAKKYNL